MTDNANPMVDPTLRRFRGCSKITDFEITDKLGEGTFGIVSKGRSKRTGAVVALKMILLHNEKDGFPITALREIKLLKMLSHPNILSLDEMAVERVKDKKRAKMYMITPYMDHDLAGMTTNPDIHFSMGQIKCYLLQLLEGLRYLHDSNILHRDMKAANILINNRGTLQIADFGLARHYDGPTPRPGYGNGEATRDYTTLVVTRWYRPPELLLQLRKYTPAIDMWGAGCVFAEMFERRPILEGKSDLNQAELIFQLVGSPNEHNMPGWSTLPGCEGVKEWSHHKGNIASRFEKRLGPEGLDLLQQLLKLDYRARINAYDAIRHPFFETHPRPVRADELPQYQDSHEMDKRNHQQKRNALPPAPAGGTVGMGPEAWGSGAPGDHANGSLYSDRGGRNQPRDRPPPGHPLPPRPARPIDDRPPPAHRDRDRDGGAGQRRPAWSRGGGPPNDSRPPYSNGARNESLPADDRRGAAPGAGLVDTYVPNYADRPPPPRRDNNDGIPRRDRDRERDDGFDRRGGREGFRDRDRDWDRDRGEFRRRSRSPGSDRGGRGRESDQQRKERLQDRERDFYRR